MARRLSHPLPGVAKQLLSATSTPALQDSLHLATAAVNALKLPYQQCWIHSPAGSGLASGAHSYHGSRDDEEAGNQDNKDEGAGAGDSQANDADNAVTRQMEAIQEAIQQALREGRSVRDAGQLPENVARSFMRDPLGMILSSQGVPMGISLKVNPQKLFKHRQEQLQREGDADKQDWREMLSQVESGRRSSSSADDHSTAVPRTDAQLLKLKLAETANKLVRDARSARHTMQQEQQQQQEVEQQQIEHQEEQLQVSSSADRESSDSTEQQQRTTTVGQQVKEQLAALMAAVDHDSWGTTQQSPAEIAQQIAASNKRAGSGGGGGGEDGGDDDGNESDGEPLQLSPVEERYADQSAVTAELKEMDEIYEVLAKVPWLDDDDVDERELRGVVAVGLLGTLEEVGWQLREPLLSLWGGERDLDRLTANIGPREAAAITAILYHTEQLEQQYDKAPAAGVAAALAAAGGPAVSPMESHTSNEDGSK